MPVQTDAEPGLTPQMKQRSENRHLEATIELALGKVTQLCQTVYWKCSVALIAFIVALLFSFPNLDDFFQFVGISKTPIASELSSNDINPFRSGNWIGFLEKVDNPLKPSTQPLQSHSGKNAFRLTVPIIAKLFSLGPRGVCLVQYCCGLLFFYILAFVVFRITNSKTVSALATVNIALLYPGYCFSLLAAHFDSFAFLALLLLFGVFSPLALLTLSQFALWTDERSILSLALMFFGFQIFGEKSPQQKLTPKARWIAISLIVYGGARFLLGLKTGLSTPTEVGDVSIKNIILSSELLWTGIWSYFRGMWIIVALAIYYIVSQFSLRLKLFSVLTLLGMLVSPFVVYDVTRSGGYLFPLILFAFDGLYTRVKSSELEKLLLISLVVSFASGPVFVSSVPLPDSWLLKGVVGPHEPLPLRIYEYLYLRIF